MRHRAGHVVHRPHPQRHLVEREVCQRLFFTGNEERGRGVLGLRLEEGGAALHRREAVALQIPAGLRQGAARQQPLTAGQMLVEGAREPGRVEIAHGGLHRQHPGHTRPQQRLGEARGLAVVDAAMAGVEQDQRQRPPFLLERSDQLSGRCGYGAAVFVLQHKHPGVAVAGEVEHVVGVGLDRRADHGGMTHLENAHLGVPAAVRWLNRVEDVLQLPLLIENRRGGLSLVGRAHGDEDLEGAGEGLTRARRETQRPTQHDDRGVGRQQAVTLQAQGLEGEPELPAEIRHARLQCGALGGDRIPAQAGTEATQEVALGTAQRWGKRSRCAAVHLFTDAHFHPHALGRAFAAQGDEHPLDPPALRRPNRRRPALAPEQRVGDLLDASARERPQQRWYPGVIAHHHRDQDLALLDPRIREVADLGLHPAVF